MKEKILGLLRQNAGGFVSGEEIATNLGVSRTAIWKHIRDLKAKGYAIESHARSGYSLLEEPDIILPEVIKNGLKTEVIGREIICHESVDSTNNELKLLARKGAQDGCVVVSEMQTGGKGRLERSFHCPKGGLWFSVLLRPQLLPAEAPKFTLLAAVAVARAMNSFGLEAGIKWPNDILYQGKKLTGILTELSAEIDRINYVIIGIGINVNLRTADFPEEIREKAGSMADILGEKISLASFLRQLLMNLDELYLMVKREGFKDILGLWREYSLTLGQEVRVLGREESFSGRAVDIDEDGALLVEAEGSLRRVLAGDVSIRSMS